MIIATLDSNKHSNEKSIFIQDTGFKQTKNKNAYRFPGKA